MTDNKPKYKWEIDDLIKFSLINKNLANQLDIFDIFQDFDSFKNSSNINNYLNTENKLFTDKLIDFNRSLIEIKEICHKHEIKILSIFDEDYPFLLTQIPSPPLILYYKGNLNDNGNRISVVGTRRCTEYGKICTEFFVESFVKNGVTIVSGLATGIDTIAHFSAIKNDGKTIAVIASGIDKITPATMQTNANKILDANGAIISTFVPGTSALPPYFLFRNRIISGLSQATLVVESSYRGGSLNTARNANEQNREVYAIPGRINSERSKGTNKLIWDNNAKIALAPDDILKDLKFPNYDENNLFANNEAINKLTENQLLIYNNIDSEATNPDKLSEITGLSIQEVLSELFLLEMNGLIKQIPGNNYIKF